MHRISKADEELFAKMNRQYRSDEEREFFENLRRKEETEFTVSNDLILNEDNNSDGIYIVRCEYEEYIVGQEHCTEEVHLMNLAEALAINLKDTGLLNISITLFEWLRRRNYKGVEYNHNYDKI